MLPALALVADLRTLQLVDWSEARLRVDSVPGSGQTAAFDLTTSPSATLGIRSRVWQLTLTYAPFLSLPDLEQGIGQNNEPLVLQTAALTADWHNRHLDLSLSENASYGQENTSNLLIGQAQPGMPQPITSGATITEIGYASSLTTLATSYAPTRDWRFGLRAGYFAFGGVGTFKAGDTEVPSSQIIAFQHGPTGEASVNYGVTRRLSTFLQVDGVRTETEPGPCFAQEDMTTGTCAPDSYIAGALVGVRHVFSPVSDGSIAAGAGVVRARLAPEDTYATTYYPEADATYEYRLSASRHRVVLRVDAGLSPTIDTRDGAVDNRAQATGIFTLLSGDFTLSNSFGVARSVGNAEILPSTIFFVTSRADYRLERHFVLSFGLSFFWQSQDRADAGGEDIISSGIASVAITADSLPIRF